MADDLTAKLMDAALTHVPFDGWSEATFRAAIADVVADPVVVRSLFPRGAVDMAMLFHRRGDDEMVARLNRTDLDGMSVREKVTFAVRTRIEMVGDREVVRRGTTLFALPTHAADGARLIWGTADRIWVALGDTSRDINWYTKRATLSGVYSSTVLFWLGDDSINHQATWDFLDRRIEDVMRIEKAKASMRKNAPLQRLLAGPNWLLSRVRAPETPGADDLPGGWVAPRQG